MARPTPQRLEFILEELEYTSNDRSMAHELADEVVALKREFETFKELSTEHVQILEVSEDQFHTRLSYSTLRVTELEAELATYKECITAQHYAFNAERDKLRASLPSCQTCGGTEFYPQVNECMNCIVTGEE